MASTSCCYDPEVFCDLLHEHIGLSKFSTAVGSTTAVPEDPDCVIFEYQEAVGGFADNFTAAGSTAHAEKPKKVSADLVPKRYGKLIMILQSELLEELHNSTDRMQTPNYHEILELIRGCFNIGD